MPPWLSQISSAQKKEGKHSSSKWIQLATVCPNNSPRVRTVVFRGWSDLYEMKIFTDKRSQKYNDLIFNNNVEICWLFRRSKIQFRLRGTSKIDLGKDTLRHWQQLELNAKSMWAWPAPGEEFVAEKSIKIANINNEQELSENFILLKINITHVDQLILDKPIHTRKRWIKKEEWIEECINP